MGLQEAAFFDSCWLFGLARSEEEHLPAFFIEKILVLDQMIGIHADDDLEKRMLLLDAP